MGNELWADLHRLLSNFRLTWVDIFRTAPQVQIYEHDARTLVVEIVVPKGFSPDEVDVSIDRRAIHVRSRVVHRYVESGKGVQEGQRAFAWSFSLPEGVDPQLSHIERGKDVLRLFLHRRPPFNLPLHTNGGF